MRRYRTGYIRTRGMYGLGACDPILQIGSGTPDDPCVDIVPAQTEFQKMQAAATALLGPGTTMTQTPAPGGASAGGTLLGLSTTTWMLIGGVVVFASLLGGRR